MYIYRIEEEKSLITKKYLQLLDQRPAEYPIISDLHDNKIVDGWWWRWYVGIFVDYCQLDHDDDDDLYFFPR